MFTVISHAVWHEIFIFIGSHESKGCKLSQAFKGLGAFHGCRTYCLRLMAGWHGCHGYVVLMVPGAYRGLGVDGGRSAINLNCINRIKSIFIFTSVFRSSLIKMILTNLKFVQYLASVQCEDWSGPRKYTSHFQLYVGNENPVPRKWSVVRVVRPDQKEYYSIGPSCSKEG